LNFYRAAAAGPTLARCLRAALIKTEPKPLNYLDIGARYGLPRQLRILERLGKISPIFVEADPEEAKRLQENGRTLCAALGSQHGHAVELNLTRAVYLSSILDPLPGTWPTKLAAGAEVVERIPMTLSRLDAIWPSEWGDPHFIKVDTQGYDLEVLKGFGDLLHRVSCAEVEVRIAQQYAGQATPFEIHSFMKGHGFDVVGFKANGLQGGQETIVFNAFFIRSNVRDTPAVRMWRIINNVGSADRIAAFGV
jgi:FkbM family methyltransferase